MKLEQYGPYRIVRPEGQAIWLPSLPQKEWDQADAVFTGNTDEEGMGRWAFPKEPLGETWPMQHDGISFHGRFTSFRHVGVFPEQAAHWSYMDGLVREGVKSGRSVKVLNLFGYTGLASLVAARAGAEVTHVDASKKAILWARENQEMAGLSDKPIRWICEDAMKFVQREERRGSFYDIILLDPPAYGRGPSGEVWQLFEHLPAMVDTCRSILTPAAGRHPDCLFDPRLFLRHSRTDARPFHRPWRHGRIGRTYSARTFQRPNGRARAFHIHVQPLGSKMSRDDDFSKGGSRAEYSKVGQVKEVTSLTNPIVKDLRSLALKNSATSRACFWPKD